MNFSLVAGAACLVAFCLSGVASAENNNGGRDSKLFPIFNVVNFENDVCTSDNRNGTCYLATECSTLGGTAGTTSCASGFGVCCLFVLSTCGNSTSENNTYLVQSAVTSLTSTCEYTICKEASSICRIKFDFTSLVLAGPVDGTTASPATGVQLTNGGAVGDCNTDTFSITSPGSIAPPIICGTNNGQHMIVDASDSCHTVSISLGASDTTTSRSWSIAVSQYTCGQEELAGPPGCLQYHIGSTGRIANYGVQLDATRADITATTAHLSSQDYEICIRRELNQCYICYQVNRLPSPVTLADPASFGLSLSKDITGTSVVGSYCSQDYITIPSGQTIAIAIIAGVSNAAGTESRICGRIFNTDSASTASTTICSKTIPFTVGVKFDADEVAGIAATNTNEQETNAAIIPGGIVGFDLTYAQGSTNC